MSRSYVICQISNVNLSMLSEQEASRIKEHTKLLIFGNGLEIESALKLIILCLFFA